MRAAWGSQAREPSRHARGQGRGRLGGGATEYCSIHPSSDDSPFSYLTLWDDDDVRQLARIDRGHPRARQPRRASSSGMAGVLANNRQTPRAAAGAVGAPGSLRPAHGGAGDGQGRHRSSCDWHRLPPRSARSGPASTSSMSMPAMTICRSSSCRRESTGAPTSMAARSTTACGSLREMIEVTREAVGGKARRGGAHGGRGAARPRGHHA